MVECSGNKLTKALINQNHEFELTVVQETLQILLARRPGADKIKAELLTMQNEHTSKKPAVVVDKHEEGSNAFIYRRR